MEPKRDGFSNRFGVIAAAAGSAVGLGNIWRFPYVLGENGGGAFLLIYLSIILILGIPLMVTEMSLGRMAGRNVFGTFKFLAPKSKWYLVGVMGIAAAFMILSFYSAVAGWTLEYTYQAVANGFSGKNPEEVNVMFSSFITNDVKTVFWMAVFSMMTAVIVVAGIEKGIERYNKILMPMLLIIILILDIRAITLPGATAGLDFLFKPDFSKINGETFLKALGQAFFSLSLGMGAMITYGSYIRKKENLVSSATWVSFSDTIVAVLAGIAIFPAVFAFQIEPNAGPGLVFQTLPNIFLKMPGGYYFAILFFVILVIAALTSSVSLLEVIVAYFTEELKMTRKAATILGGGTAAILGIFCSISTGSLAGFKIFRMTIFDLLEFASSNILLPLGGLLITIFAGWIIKTKVLKTGISEDRERPFFFRFYLFVFST
jgi:NSS family neurotransmitter:Na+ symporter